MARPWRLRHKLLLGLGLVVGSIGLLLSGTLHGLSAFLDTTNTIDRKLVELAAVEKLRRSLGNTLLPGDSRQSYADEPARLKAKLAEARQSYTAYTEEFDRTRSLKRDPDKGFVETSLMEDFDVAFSRFEKALEAAIQPKELAGSNSSVSISEDPELKAAYHRLMQLTDELSDALYKDMYQSIGSARRQNHRSLFIISSATVLGVLLVLTMLYLFSAWIFRPIRQLQAGVQRVANEDFDHPIVLQSRDELEELATAFNQMTQRLQDIYRDLARQVNERSRQLVRSERLVSVGFLAAGVAHEINNPLASIVFCSDALERRLRDLLARFPQESEIVSKYLKMIHEEAFRCKEITRRLLEYSRVGESRREPTNLAELIQSVLEIAQHLQSCKGKRIVFQPLAHVVAAVNAQDIKSVVLNLVVNALDSMDEGGTLTITLTVRGTIAEMVFADTGCGMTPEVMENIFEPFYTRNRTGKGTGLGLFISHQIVDQHEGAIEVTSPGIGAGSVFTVRLPLQPTTRRSLVTMSNGQETNAGDGSSALLDNQRLRLAEVGSKDVGSADASPSPHWTEDRRGQAAA